MWWGPPQLPDGFRTTLIADQLLNVTTFEFAPDGRLFVSEQGGRLRVIKDGVDATGVEGISDSPYDIAVFSGEVHQPKIGVPPLESMPDAQAVSAQGLTEWTFPGTEIKIVKITEGEQAGQFLCSGLCGAHSHADPGCHTGRLTRARLQKSAAINGQCGFSMHGHEQPRTAAAFSGIMQLESQ